MSKYTVQIELETIFLSMIEAFVVGLLMNLDSSPLRLFGIDKVAASHEVMVRSTRLVSANGTITPFAPRATVPVGLH